MTLSDPSGLNPLDDKIASANGSIATFSALWMSAGAEGNSVAAAAYATNIEVLTNYRDGLVAQRDKAKEPPDPLTVARRAGAATIGTGSFAGDVVVGFFNALSKAKAQEKAEKHEFKKAVFTLVGADDAKKYEDKQQKTYERIVSEIPEPENAAQQIGAIAGAVVGAKADAKVSTPRTAESPGPSAIPRANASPSGSSPRARAPSTRAEGPTGDKISLMRPKDRFNAAVAEVPEEPGHQDVIVHGNSVEFGRTEGGKSMTPQQVGQAIVGSPNYRGGAVRLLTCGAAADGGCAAQGVADTIGQMVLAPNDDLWALPGNVLVVAPEDPFKKGEPDMSRVGQWIPFRPRGKN